MHKTKLLTFLPGSALCFSISDTGKLLHPVPRPRCILDSPSHISLLICKLRDGLCPLHSCSGTRGRDWNHKLPQGATFRGPVPPGNPLCTRASGGAHLLHAFPASARLRDRQQHQDPRVRSEGSGPDLPARGIDAAGNRQAGWQAACGDPAWGPLPGLCCFPWG